MIEQVVWSSRLAKQITDFSVDAEDEDQARPRELLCAESGPKRTGPQGDLSEAFAAAFGSVPTGARELLYALDALQLES